MNEIRASGSTAPDSTAPAPECPVTTANVSSGDEVSSSETNAHSSVPLQTTSSSSIVATNNNANNNDTSSSNSTNAHNSHPRSQAQQAQHQQQQQQQQQPLQQIPPPPPPQNNVAQNLMAPNHHARSNVQHFVTHLGPNGTNGGYHVRHAQSYHSQSMQHYHPHPLAHHHPHHNPHQQQHPSKYNHHHNPHQHHHQRGDNESHVNHVLLITIINPHYTITCGLIHQICSPYGKVNRIVIFKKNGVQAMVEFDNVESAKRAKTMLYGCDIFSGCCTLRVEYAKPTRLNIHKNDPETYDYTNPNLNGGSNGGPGANVSDGNAWNHSVMPNQLAGQTANGGSHHPPSHVAHHRHRGGRNNSAVTHRGIPGGHGQHHGSHSFHLHPQGGPHPNQAHHHVPPSGYPMEHNASLDQQQQAPDTSNDAFQQDEIYNSARGPPVSGANSGVPANQSPYVGVESPYLAAHGPPAHTGPMNNVYPRPDGNGHQHHPHHHNHHHQQQHPRSNQSNSSQGAHGAHFTLQNASIALVPGQPNLAPPQGPVMMVYGLQADKFNCDGLFNLFCLYGNIVRIKFLRTKEGCAMVQMGDVMAVDRCVSSLNKMKLFGNDLQISYSKQPFLHDVIQPFILPDGSPSYKDYTVNKNNRFKNPEVAGKNRILPPSQVLHFFNAPHGITDDELVHLFKQNSGHDPTSVKIFTPKSENIKSFSGLVTFRDSIEATEALVLCNHLNMPKPGVTHPYILRLCFSPPNFNRQQQPQQQQQVQNSQPQPGPPQPEASPPPDSEAEKL